MTNKAILDGSEADDPFAALEAIETGEADVDAARRLIIAALDADWGEDGASEIFCTLRSWTGRMLRGSAGAADLRAWHDLFKATGAQFRGPLADYAIRIDVLSDLLYERTGMAENRRVEDVVTRRHVSAILSCIAAAPEGRMSRADVGRVMGLQQANLTRVSTMMIDAGLIARVEQGRTVALELTAVGSSQARNVSTEAPVDGVAATGEADHWIGPDPKEVPLIDRPMNDPAMDEWEEDIHLGSAWKQAA